jgi:hypothetical protein
MFELEDQLNKLCFSWRSYYFSLSSDFFISMSDIPFDAILYFLHNLIINWVKNWTDIYPRLFH